MGLMAVHKKGLAFWNFFLDSVDQSFQPRVLALHPEIGALYRDAMAERRVMTKGEEKQALVAAAKGMAERRADAPGGFVPKEAAKMRRISDR